MSSTVKLPYIRFVKRVSNGTSLSKYGYIGMMESLADAIKSAPWVKSGRSGDDVTLTTNKITKTDGVWNSETGEWTTKPTYSTYSGDSYDAFNQAGDAVASNATMCGYSGCVAYRFSVPSSESSNAIESVKLSLQRDRYLRAGVRIGMQISSIDTPSDDWSFIRGEATGCVRSTSTSPAEDVVGVASFGFLGQPNVANLLASRAAAATIEFDTSSSFTGLTTATYLWVYVTLEDPAAYWDMYSAKEKRQYYIEGSAMLMADGCEFTLTNAITEPMPEELEIGYASVTYNGYSTSLPQNLQPHPTAASDAVVISRCGAPVVVADNSGNFVGTGMSAYTDYALKLNSIGDGEPEDAVRAVYAEFYKDGLIRCPAKGAGSLITKPAAAFSISFMIKHHSTDIQGTDYGKCVSIQRKKLIVPFTLPIGFSPSQLRLNWEGYDTGESTGIDHAIAMHHNVWLAPNRDLTNAYDLATLQKHELYTAEVSAVDEFVLLGSSIHYDGEGAVEEVVDIPVKLGHGAHSLLLTLFIDQDQLTFGEGGTASDTAQHDYAPLGVIFGYFNPTIYGEEDTMYFGGALSGGWAPTITLIS